MEFYKICVASLIECSKFYMLFDVPKPIGFPLNYYYYDSAGGRDWEINKDQTCYSRPKLKRINLWLNPHPN